MPDFDVLVVGSGPAGISCALELHETKVDYLLVERGDRIGLGFLQIQSEIPNVLGGCYRSGEELRRRSEELCQRIGVNCQLNSDVKAVDLGAMEIQCGDRRISSQAIVLATGYRRRQLQSEPVGSLSTNVYYDKHGKLPLLSGKVLAIIGGGDNALMDAAELSSVCPEIHLIHRSGVFRARQDVVTDATSRKNVYLHAGTTVRQFLGGDKTEQLVLHSPGDGETRLAVDAVIIRVGYVPNTEMVQGQVEMDASGHIKVKPDCSTSVPGFFAIGDITTPGYPRVATAMGNGSRSAHAVRTWLEARKDSPDSRRSGSGVGCS